MLKVGDSLYFILLLLKVCNRTVQLWQLQATYAIIGGTSNVASVTEELNFYFISFFINSNVKLKKFEAQLTWLLEDFQVCLVIRMTSVCESTLSTKSFMKPELSCTSGRNFASKFRYAVCVKHIPDFEDSAAKKESKVSLVVYFFN